MDGHWWEAFGPGVRVEGVTPAKKLLAETLSQGQPKHRKAGECSLGMSLRSRTGLLSLTSPMGEGGWFCMGGK